MDCSFRGFSCKGPFARSGFLSYEHVRQARERKRFDRKSNSTVAPVDSLIVVDPDDFGKVVGARYRLPSYPNVPHYYVASSGHMYRYGRDNFNSTRY